MISFVSLFVLFALTRAHTNLPVFGSVLVFVPISVVFDISQVCALGFN